MIPIPINDSVSSLSAILLDDNYYQILLEGRDIIDGISVHIDSRDIKKHRNDILKISSEMILEKYQLPNAVKKDMTDFIEKFHVSDTELKNLKITGIHEKDILKILKQTLCL